MIDYSFKPKGPFAMPSEEYEKAVTDLIRKHEIACEQLTEKQLASVIMQALASGDLIKQVVVSSHAQAVIYVPYAEVGSLRSRITHLESLLLDQYGIEEPMSAI